MSGIQFHSTDIIKLQARARNVRIHCLKMTNSGKCSHIASSLSAVEILVSLYFQVMKINPQDPHWEARDRLIVSKGHAAAAVYSTLAECGYFPIAELQTFYKNGTTLAGHVSHFIPGVEASTGSLGHGLGIAAGMAYAGKAEGKDSRIFCLLSDGECDEGSTWEAILFSGFHKLSNLCVIVDYNQIQALGRTEEVLNLEPFGMKWEAFGWDVVEVDGHSFPHLLNALSQRSGSSSAKPLCIIAHTVKGKGVSFMEDNLLWHYRTPQNEEFISALKELESLT